MRTSGGRLNKDDMVRLMMGDACVDTNLRESILVGMVRRKVALWWKRELKVGQNVWGLMGVKAKVLSWWVVSFHRESLSLSLHKQTTYLQGNTNVITMLNFRLWDWNSQLTVIKRERSSCPHRNKTTSQTCKVAQLTLLPLSTVCEFSRSCLSQM